MSVKVFVSSRFEEFKQLRRQILKRCEDDASFLEPVLLDDGQAAPVDPIQRSLDALRDCELVLLLLGTTYSENEALDRSIVHQEYLHAVESEKPVFAYAAVAAESEQVDSRATKLLDQVRDVKHGWPTIGELTGDPARDAEEIVQQVERHLMAPGQNDGQSIGRFSDVLLREMAYLGVYGTSPSPQADQGVDRLGLVFTALELGDLREAWRQVERSQEDWKYDWATNYVHTRLLEISRRSTPLKLALTTSKRAQDTLENAALTGQPEQEAQRRLIATKVMRARLLRLTGEDPDEARRQVDSALELFEVDREALVERLLQAAWFRDQERARETMKPLLQTYPDLAVGLLRARDLAPVRTAARSRASQLLRQRFQTASRSLSLVAVPVHAEDRGPDELLEGFRELASEHGAALDRLLGHTHGFLAALRGDDITTASAYQELVEAEQGRKDSNTGFEAAYQRAKVRAEGFDRGQQDPALHRSGIGLAVRKLRSRFVGADPKLARHLRRPGRHCVAAAVAVRSAEDRFQQARRAFCQAAEPSWKRAVDAGLQIEDLTVEQILDQGIDIVRRRIAAQLELHSSVFGPAPAIGQKEYRPPERAQAEDLTRVQSLRAGEWSPYIDDHEAKLLVRKVNGGYSLWAALLDRDGVDRRDREKDLLAREEDHFEPGARNPQDPSASHAQLRHALLDGRRPEVVLAAKLGRPCKPSMLLHVGALTLAMLVLLGGPLLAWTLTPHRAMQFPGFAADAQGWERSYFDMSLGSDVRMWDIDSTGPVSVAIGYDDVREAPRLWISEERGRWERLPHDEARFGSEVDSSVEVFSIVAAGSGFVAVGRDGDAAAVWTSIDGRRWRQTRDEREVFGQEGERARMHSIAVGGPGFVAVGEERVDAGRGPVVWLSEHGDDWQRAPLDGPAFAGWGSLLIHRVAAAGPGLVAVGWDGDTSSGAVWTSVDGVTWERSPDPAGTQDSWGGARILSVTDGEAGLVAVGIRDDMPAVWTSEDGIDWDRAPREPESIEAQQGGRMRGVLLDVAATPTGFIAVGVEEVTQWSRPSTKAMVWTSADGGSWQRVDDEDHVFSRFLTSSDISAVHADERGAVAVGSFGWAAAVWSQDGQPSAEMTDAASRGGRGR